MLSGMPFCISYALSFLILTFCLSALQNSYAGHSSVHSSYSSHISSRVGLLSSKYASIHSSLSCGSTIFAPHHLQYGGSNPSVSIPWHWSHSNPLDISIQCPSCSSNSIAPRQASIVILSISFLGSVIVSPVLGSNKNISTVNFNPSMISSFVIPYRSFPVLLYMGCSTSPKEIAFLHKNFL